MKLNLVFERGREAAPQHRVNYPKRKEAQNYESLYRYNNNTYGIFLIYDH
jgi:hypothetical protein